jgi:lipoprotein-releasing system permease protein
MTQGRLTDLIPGKFQIVLGQELADSLQVGLGDKVTVVIPKTLVTPAGITPRLKRFTVVGLFSVGMHEYDSAMALMHLQDAQKLFRLREQVSGLRLKLTDLYLARSVSQELYAVLPDGAYPNDWTWQHANFFRALKIEKRMMFLIVSLIIAVAAFNIVSSLVMVVTDKKSDIAILKTLGASPASIMGIFVVQGIVIGLIGTVIGVILGVSLSLNIETLVPMLENWLDMEFLPGDVYYISTFPSDMHWQDVWQVGSLAFALTLLATLYPAWRAAHTRPAEALRYE